MTDNRLPKLPLPLHSNHPNSPSELTSDTAQPLTPSIAPERIACNGCKNILEDTGSTGDSVVVSFGNSLWHVDCFRCAKCRNLVEHDTNLLLLSDGSPVCENCSYICSVCKNPISNEAIVTGDESYHADCFRCRSCQNRIEELIFAKTSQGIYCMTCHNDRVTRSRRHAEAKRNKSSNPNAKKERERDPHSPQLASNNNSNSNYFSSLNSSTDKALDNNSHHGHMKSPLPDLPPSSPSPGRSDGGALRSMRRTSIGNLLGITQQKKRSPSAGPQEPPSRHSSRLPVNVTSPTSPTVPPSPPPKDGPIRSPSTSSKLFEQILSTVESQPTGLRAVPPSLPLSPASYLHDHLGGTARPRYPTRPATSDGSRSLNSSTQSSSNILARSFESSPQMPSPKPSHPDDVSFSRITDDNHQQSSPSINVPLVNIDVAKANTRRSVMLGPGRGRATDDLHLDHLSPYFSRPDLIEEDLEPGSSESTDEHNHQNQSSIPSTPHPTYPEPKNRITVPGTTDRPLSFYDPEVLFYLDSVGNDSNPPNGDHEDGVPSGVPLDSAALDTRSSTPEMEHLASDDRQQLRSRRDGKDDSDEVSRKVRESISLNRDLANATGSGGDMSLDVALVEQLLSSLQNTKERMKELQNEYNAMKRASRTAHEGFSLAREEYDREVSARQEAESRMRELKSEMFEQASKLTEIKSLKTLEQESEELKNSVSGLQKHLSQLTIERDLRVAEVEALNDIQSVTETEAESSVSKSLSAKLDSVKQDYRDQIDGLVLERDRLKAEIQHLAKVRDSHARELDQLNQRHDQLSELNASAARQLEDTRASIGRLGALSSSHGHQHVVSRNLNDQRGGGAHSPSSSQQSHLAQQAQHDLADEQSPLPTEVTIATTRKFKWGKTQKAVVAPRPTHHKDGSINEANGLPSSAGPTAGTSGTTPTTANNNSGPNALLSLPAALRPHNFQPVSALRPVRCDYCGDKFWGLAEVRCTVCGSYSHTKCAPNFFGCQNTNGNLNIDENSSEIVEACIFGNDLITQAKLENNLVPHVVVKCIEAVEQNGLKFEGIYRKTGGMSSVKAVQNSFEKGLNVDLNDLNKFNDISAITSALKNYFRQLPNPLFTFELHEAFVTVAAMPQETVRLEALERVVYQLPQIHFETLNVLMKHLNRIQRLSDSNKMTAQNLGVVFGPTLLRSPNPNRQFSDMPHTAKVIELMVDHAQVIFRKPFGTISSNSEVGGNEKSTGNNEKS
ncbi:uncharacterized protein MELLADRAFT_91892 [Melampsora larici-populina 98AG31]|uniref:Signal transducer n=1 Tax=Melampsora larici-populina (strain 98AG31 / pathotype 3-4-7) TaxID=747676 RepID=F4S0R2_MELLP|nr:uncharacterized protein MELLADRAFT_91892 [Melampsora larici-populina 98AG31]EGG01819.1 hypothetical protein MELLADRAFT_91892 [Melampsora larici-populina 98AG31]